MSYNPLNPNGQATSANSAPVVLASDQSALLAKLTDGTQAANTAAGDTGQNTLLVAPGRKEVTFSTTTAQAVASTDASNYRWVSVQIAAQGTGSTVTFQGSNDTTNWVSLASFASSTSNQSSTTSSTSITGLYDGPLTTRYFRLSISGISAGTTSGTIEFSTMPSAIRTMAQAAVQSGTWTVQPGNTANTTPWLVTANLSPAASGGWSVSSQTALTSTATVSSAAGKLGGYMLFNPNAATAYVQVFDTASAPTLGTTTPTLVIPVPGGAGANLEMTNGIAIAAGIRLAATTTATGNTLVSSGLTGFVLYK